MGRRSKDYIAGEQGLESEMDLNDEQDAVEETKEEAIERLKAELAKLTASGLESFVYKIPEGEYQRRIKLDVGHPDYINPSYDR